MPKGVYKHRRGFHLSEEHRRKIAIANTGRKLNAETKRKCGLANIGRKISEETREKLKKRIPYWLGKKRGRIHTEEWKRELSRRLKEKPIYCLKQIAKIGELNKGKFGKNHPCFKEIKKHPFHKSIRELYKYRQWRFSVFKRDGFRCVLCGKSGYIEADHYPIRFITIIRKYTIKTLEQAINCKELWDIKNGRTLCVKCHKANFKRL